MKYIIYTKNNTGKKASRDEATIRFSRKTQAIISSVAVERFGLKPKDKVAIMQSETDANQWYLIRHPQGMPLRQNGKSKSLAFNNTVVAGYILNHFEIAANAATFYLGKIKMVNKIRSYHIEPFS